MARCSIILLSLLLGADHLVCPNNSCPSDQPDLPYTMLVEEGESAETVKLKAGTQVLALFKVDTTHSKLRMVRLKRVSFKGEYDPADAPLRSRLVFAGKQKPIFGLYGGHDLEPGPIRTVLQIDQEPSHEFSLGKELTLSMGKGRPWTFKLEEHKKAKTTDPYDYPSVFKIIMTRGKISQEVGDMESLVSEGAGISWAGDLDGDGKIDFLLSGGNEKGFGSWRLFLSSMAKKGELVGLAAEDTFECGC